MTDLELITELQAMTDPELIAELQAALTAKDAEIGRLKELIIELVQIFKEEGKRTPKV